MPTRLLANMTVSDLPTAVEWYTRFFGRAPDVRPMDGLVEWHLADTFGVQVWADPEGTDPDRAGRSAMVLDEPDLDATVQHLHRAGIAHAGPQDATSSRILPSTDPDGNRIVLTGPFRQPAATDQVG